MSTGDNANTKCKTRRQYITATGLTVLGSMAGCIGEGGSGSGNSGVEMTLASSYEPGHILVQASENFKQQIEEETDGQFSVQINAGGSYGGEGDHAEVLREGSIQGAAVGTPVWELYVSEYFIFNVPYSLNGFDHLQRVMTSDVMNEGRQRLRENANHRMIGGERPWIYRGTRHFTSNKPIRSPSDVQGLSLRLPQIDAWVQLWSQIGAQPTPVALNELYTSLQTGTVDASEGPPDQVATNNLQEVQSHYSLTSHHITPGAIYVNNEWFNSLDESYQDLIMEIGPGIHEEATQTAMQNEQQIISELNDSGMTIVEDVDTEAFRAEGEPAVREIFNNNWVVSYDELQEM